MGRPSKGQRVTSRNLQCEVEDASGSFLTLYGREERMEAATRLGEAGYVPSVRGGGEASGDRRFDQTRRVGRRRR